MSIRESVAGKTVLITGAARGIGAATARELHRRGANIALVGLEPELLAGLAGELGPRAAHFTADVTDPGALAAAAAGTVARFGGIDVVVANAGVAPPTTSIAAIDPDDFERTVHVDLLGVWRTVKATIAEVSSRGGHFVLVSSMYAFFNGVLNASYAVSKAGVEQFGRALRVESAATGTTVSIAYFAFIDTDMVREAFGRPAADELRKAFPPFVTAPMEIAGIAEKIAEGIERRSPRITAPRWLSIALWLRGPLELFDRRIARDPHTARALSIAQRPPDGPDHSVGRS